MHVVRGNVVRGVLAVLEGITQAYRQELEAAAEQLQIKEHAGDQACGGGQLLYSEQMHAHESSDLAAVKEGFGVGRKGRGTSEGVHGTVSGGDTIRGDLREAETCAQGQQEGRGVVGEVEEGGKGRVASGAGGGGAATACDPMPLIATTINYALELDKVA